MLPHPAFNTDVGGLSSVLLLVQKFFASLHIQSLFAFPVVLISILQGSF